MTATLNPRGALSPPTGLATSALIRDKIINHVVLVVDASPSMAGHVTAVREQLRMLITDLAEQSKIMDQETRVTIYAFSTEVRVLVFDVDVVRLVDLNVWDRYDIIRFQMTALNDAAAIGLDDLATTSTLYGDHGFLVYLITDGKENDSRRYASSDVARRMDLLPENWTVAALVPDVTARRYAMNRLEVPMDNIAIWDTDSSEGFVSAGATIRTATSDYMQARASGVRGTRTLFSTGVDAVNRDTVSALLTPMDPNTYVLARTGDYRGRVDDFVNRLGIPFVVGNAFYEFTKREEIQPQKLLVIVNRHSGEVFHDPTPRTAGAPASPKVRAMIGLTSDVSVKVKPDHNPDFKIFVQSTAPNRVVLPGTEVFVKR